MLEEGGDGGWSDSEDSDDTLESECMVAEGEQPPGAGLSPQVHRLRPSCGRSAGSAGGELGASIEAALVSRCGEKRPLLTLILQNYGWLGSSAVSHGEFGGASGTPGLDA